ncbi:MAG TPA: two-component regulator propeller domain-containing protein [Ideonella sp.]|nr:two-component regulator propeller domain-containing protein [Ideonella sp.]
MIGARWGLCLRRPGTLLLGLLLCCGAHALDPRRSLSQLHHTAWTQRDGAPTDAVALAQTADGTLWLGTPTGLYRFDGVRFERLRTGDGRQEFSADVRSLLALPDGGLWIGLLAGGTQLLRDGRLTAHGVEQGLPLGSVTSLARDSQARVWAATTTGLAVRDGERWRPVGQAQAHSGDLVNQILVDRGGKLWVTGPGGVFVLERGSERFTRLDRPSSRGFLAQTQDGTVWYSDRPRMAALTDPAGRHAGAVPERALPASVDTGPLLGDRDGGLWVLGVDRLLRLPQPLRLGATAGEALPEQVQQFTAVQGLSGGNPRSLLEDREGNVWVATNGGLDRFRAPKFTAMHLDPFTGAALARADERGAIWAGAGIGQLYRVDAAGATPLPEQGRNFLSLHRDGDGVLWLGSHDRLLRAEAGVFSTVPLPGGLRAEIVQALLKDRSGGLWLSLARAGVFRLKDGTWHFKGGIAGLPEKCGTALVIAMDPGGRLWMSYRDGSLLRLEGEQATVFTGEHGPQLGMVQALYFDAGQRLWLGGSEGLATFDGHRFTPVRGAGDRRFGSLSGIVQADDGSLWLNGGDGIFRIAGPELRKLQQDPAYLPAWELFDHRDGVQGIATQVRPVPSALKAADGRLWFSTTRSLLWIDPARIARNPLAPSVQVRALNLAGQRHDAVDGLELPVGSTQLDIEYTALSLAMPERVRFRYRLEGVDAEWQDAETRRRAFYTNLGPGSYRFRVIAANEDGVWNEQGAQLAFTIPPAFHQTAWFLALCAAAGGAGLFGLHRMRVRQLARQLRSRLQARTEERERIARELHDTLLQSTQGLILSFQGVALQTPEGDPARVRMARALARADQALAEGRARVQDLRHDPSPDHDLPRALASVAEALAETHTVALQQVMAGPPRHLQRAARETAYRIGREALTNACLHASARRVTQTLSYEADALRLCVSDDGCGVAPEVLAAGSRSGHWGLPGMHERAREAGGQLTLSSGPGTGTRVELVLPAAVAYADHADPPLQPWRAGGVAALRALWQRLRRGGRR